MQDGVRRCLTYCYAPVMQDGGTPLFDVLLRPCYAGRGVRRCLTYCYAPVMQDGGTPLFDVLLRPCYAGRGDAAVRRVPVQPPRSRRGAAEGARRPAHADGRRRHLSLHLGAERTCQSAQVPAEQRGRLQHEAQGDRTRDAYPTNYLGGGGFTRGSVPGIFLMAPRPARTGLRPAPLSSALPELFKKKKIIFYFILQNVIAVFVFSNSRCKNACNCALNCA